MPLLRLCARLLWLSGWLGVLGATLWWVFGTLFTENPRIWVTQIEIDTSRAPIELGYRDLSQHPGASSADSVHVRVDRRDGELGLINVSELTDGSLGDIKNKRLNLSYESGDDFHAQRWRLRDGDELELNGDLIAVTRSGQRYEFYSRTTNLRLEYDLDAQGLSLQGPPAQGQWSPTCQTGYALARTTAFNIVGHVSCPQQLGVVGSNEYIGRVAIEGEGSSAYLYLEISRLLQWGAVATRRAGEQAFVDPRRQFWPLVHDDYQRLQRIVVGRTHYRVVHELLPDVLVLEPAANVHFFPADEPCGDASLQAGVTFGDCSDPQSVAAGKTLFELGYAWWLVCGLFLVASVLLYVSALQLHRHKLAAHGPVLTWLFLLGACLPALHNLLFYLLADWNQSIPGLFVSVCIGFGTLSAVYAFSAQFNLRLALLWSLLLVMTLLGAVNLIDLSILADQGTHLKYAQKHLSLGMAFVAVLTLSALFRLRVFENLGANFTAASVVLTVGIPVLIAGGLGVWSLLAGSETGVGDMQPIEAVKTIFLLVLVLMIVRINQTRYLPVQARIWVPLGTTALMVAVFAIFILVPFFQRDFSPILIVALLAIAMIVLCSIWLIFDEANKSRTPTETLLRKLYPVHKHRPGEVIVAHAYEFALFVLVAAVSLGAWIGYQKAVEYVEDLEADPPWVLSTVDRRIVGWRAPEKYLQDISYQLAASLRSIADGRCEESVVGGMVGLDLSGCSVERTENPLLVPAVQDDFVLAYFINRRGAFDGLLLLVLQIGFVMLLVEISIAAYRFVPGTPAGKEARQLYAFLTLGCAVLFALHWSISWGNAFGELPIMGQPMTLFSAANSHLLFFAAPVLAVAFVTARLAKRP